MSSEVIDAPVREVQAQQRQGSTATLMQAIAAAATNPQTDIEKMERLWLMHERITARDAEQAFNDAMSAAQADMGVVSTNATNDQTRSRYATYAQLDSHLRPIYTKHGFALSFNTGENAPPGCVRMLAYVSHKAGHTRTYTADVPSDGRGAKGNAVMTSTHAFGSGTSYGMRYLLKMIFNVAVGETDDDGNGASDSPPDQITQPAGPQTWPDDAFEVQYARWSKAVEAGIKTPVEIMTMAKTKGALTPEQHNRINKLAAMAPKKAEA